jgi:hypothetical protein
MSEMADAQKQDDVLKFHANKWSPLMIALGLGIILALVSGVLPGTGGMWAITIMFVTLGFWRQSGGNSVLISPSMQTALKSSSRQRRGSTQCSTLK